MNSRDAKYWIEKLRLEPHPEGGYFRQTYKAELRIALAEEYRPVEKPATRVQPVSPELRAASTAIHFLLEAENFSAFHRLRSDEMWHFYAGSPLIVHEIDPEGAYSSLLLGNDPEAGQLFQAVVKAGCWFASEIARNLHPPAKNAGSVGQPSRAPFALVGCTVAPGFEFEDFELAKREELAREYPRLRELIERLTREV